MSKKSSLLWQLNKTCLNKKSFNFDAANHAIEKLASQGVLMFYYKCNICSRYHLTRQEPKQYNEAEHYKVI